MEELKKEDKKPKKASFLAKVWKQTKEFFDVEPKNKKRAFIIGLVMGAGIACGVYDYIEGKKLVVDFLEPHRIVLKAEAKQDEPVAVQPKTIREMVEETFPEDPKTAWAIAMGESQGDPSRIGDRHLTFEANGKTYGMSCGLMQIRVLEGRPDCDTLLDPIENLKYARKIYDKGGWSAWSVFSNETYKKYL